jgi:hypothetical protein
MASEPSEKAKGIVLDMLHGLCDAGAIDAHAAEMVAEERERCIAWALTFTLITELLDGIESGKWPQKTP